MRLARFACVVACTAALAACTAVREPSRDAAPADVACPQGLPAQTRCLTGRDSAGAIYWIAVPPAWNRVLIVHAHGGPELGPPESERGRKDLERWAVMVRAGYAWAGSTYAQGGVAVRAAADDNERLRRLFAAQVAVPRRTILHGQSWGAGVAAVGAEMFAASRPYDGVLLTSGVLGGARSYDFRLDLRVVYQAVCGNHPLPGEPAYPLWQGLPLDAKLTRAELRRRVDDCTGVDRQREARSPVQQARLDTLLQVVRIPERSLQAHLAWGTWHFQDIVFKRTNGGNPFGNVGAKYVGSSDDAALNARVARYAVDPKAAAALAADADPGGRIKVPVLTVHAIDDPTAFVELESAFRDTMRRAGSADHLVQTFTDESEHSYLNDTAYVALAASLLSWIDDGRKPTPRSVAERCVSLESTYGKTCRFAPDYTPSPLSARVTPRGR